MKKDGKADKKLFNAAYIAFAWRQTLEWPGPLV